MQRTLTPSRMAGRGRTDRQALDELLDEVLVGYLGVSLDEGPLVLPVGFARDGDRVLLHGSTGSHRMRVLAEGVNAGAAQRQFVPGAGGPPGPGINSSGLAIYRYQTPCGTFLGHTGNMPGYTTFIGASLDGKDSVVVAINSQVSPTSAPDEFRALRALENVALCRAVERTG